MAETSAKLRSVCISDLHLGAPASLLTDVPGTVDAGPLRAALAKALCATLGRLGAATARAELTLLGDVLDLSFGAPHAAVTELAAFLDALEAAGAKKLIGAVAFVPGNHDHELWTVARYDRMTTDAGAPGVFDHTTPALAAPGAQPPAALIDRVLRGKGFPAARTFYPNMSLASEDGGRGVAFHHGHFLEPAYRLMSDILARLDDVKTVRRDAETLERLNASWIDFAWSTIGDDGRLGGAAEQGYHALLTSGAGSPLRHRLAGMLAETVQARLPLPRTASARNVARVASLAAVDIVIGRYAQMERFSYGDALSESTLAGLKTYLSETLSMQLEAEGAGAATADLTFIFGHTHKPFAARVPAPGIVRPPAVLNTGGWYLDMPVFGSRLGAAAAFVDADLNAALLRLGDVPGEPDAKPDAVRVECADGDVGANPIAKALQQAVTAEAEAWADFSARLAEGWRARQDLDLATARRPWTQGGAA